MNCKCSKAACLPRCRTAAATAFSTWACRYAGQWTFSHTAWPNCWSATKPTKRHSKSRLQGPRLQFDGDALIAICGADLSPTIGGVAVPEGRPVRVHAGAVLDFGACLSGCRAYLAVQGGFDVPPVMGSRSTYETARIGGLEGRALRSGDVLPIGTAAHRLYPGLGAISRIRRGSSLFQNGRSINITKKSAAVRRLIRIVSGRHWDDFPAPSRKILIDARIPRGGRFQSHGLPADRPERGHRIAARHGL